MPHEGLGDFEQMVLLAILRLSEGDDDVYGVPIVEDIERRTKRKVSRAAVYITMRRLERKGLLASWTSEPAAERGGKGRHCVKVTAAGNKALREARWAMNQMWAGLDAGVEDRR